MSGLQARLLKDRVLLQRQNAEPDNIAVQAVPDYFRAASEVEIFSNPSRDRSRIIVSLRCKGMTPRTERLTAAAHANMWWPL